MEEFMKSTIVLMILLVSQLSLAQTLKEKKVKQEMLERTDTLITKVKEAKVLLDNEDVEGTCKVINVIFKIYPDHLIAIGTKMNIFDGAFVKMENETKMSLIYFHQQSNICARGTGGEYLDISKTKKKLKLIRKQLEKQKKKIEKSETNFENTYNYYYEFN
jgi:hypothetical protein